MRGKRAIAVASALGATLACGDNRAPARDAPARDAPARDAPAEPLGAPDLALVSAQMAGTIGITQDTFAPTACEVIDGCVGSDGLRRLLRFDTVAANVGTAALDLGPVPAAGASGGYYQWSACAQRHLVPGYAAYTLADGSGAVVARGHKEAFCIEDTEQVQPVASHGFSCTHMGLSVGWADVYPHDSSCQWVDVTGLAPGTYTLQVSVDAGGLIPDADASNNVWTTQVTL